jgi:hypothetical protein
MNILPNALRNRRLQVASAMTILAVCGIFIGVRATLMKSSTPPSHLPRAEERTLGAQQGSDSKTKPPARVLVLRPDGFEPTAVSWPKGRFLLAINNHSGVNDITLLLDREVGGRVKEVTLKMRKQRGVGMLDLPPGNYVLTEANHPGWVCRITITPQ